MFYIFRLKRYIAGSCDGLDLSVGPGPVVIEEKEVVIEDREYKVGYILYAHG